MKRSFAGKVSLILVAVMLGGMAFSGKCPTGGFGLPEGLLRSRGEQGRPAKYHLGLGEPQAQAR
jgi:hypothetical protein